MAGLRGLFLAEMGLNSLTNSCNQPAQNQFTAQKGPLRVTIRQSLAITQENRWCLETELKAAGFGAQFSTTHLSSVYQSDSKLLTWVSTRVQRGSGELEEYDNHLITSLQSSSPDNLDRLNERDKMLITPDFLVFVLTHARPKIIWLTQCHVHLGKSLSSFAKVEFTEPDHSMLSLELAGRRCLFEYTSAEQGLHRLKLQITPFGTLDFVRQNPRRECE